MASLKVYKKSTVDEAQFWFNGYVNKQYYPIWSEEQPEKLFSPKICKTYEKIVKPIDTIDVLEANITHVKISVEMLECMLPREIRILEWTMLAVVTALTFKIYNI